VAERRYPAEDVWAWALAVAEEVHPLYVANDWRWFVEWAPQGAKEVPSIERIAASLAQKAHTVLDDPTTSGVSSGRVTVDKVAGDDENPEDRLIVSVQFDAEYRIGFIPGFPPADNPSGDQS
jgi:hypothetical protein